MLEVDIINRMKDGALVNHFLLSSFCYYHLDISPLTDEAYDRLCKRIIERWDFIDANIYPHKSLIDREALSAGTGYYIPEDGYPLIVRSSAFHYFRTANSGELARDLQEHLMPVRPPRIMRSPPATVATAPIKAGRIVRTPPKGS